MLKKKQQPYHHQPLQSRKIFVFLLIFLLGSCSSGDSPSLPAIDKQIEIPGLPSDPGAGNLAGKILGTVGRQALAGLQVTVNSKSTTSNSDGNFLLEGVGSGALAVRISGQEIYQRIAAIDTEAGRAVQLDAIERQSAFNLNFYRELARGRHPTEGDLFPIQRWTSPTPPTIYIDTNASSTEAGLISSETLERVREIVIRMIPVLSGDVYTSAPIQLRSFSSHSFDAIPDNSIGISFDDTLFRKGALGVTFTEPNFTSQAAKSLQKAWIFLLHREEYYQQGGISFEEITAHELGHGFGYRHTSLLPSIMEKNGAYGGLFSEHDRLHMRVMYTRPFGNLDIDTDALPNGKLMNSSLETQIFIEHLSETSDSEAVLTGLRQSEGFVGAFLSHSR